MLVFLMSSTAQSLGGAAYYGHTLDGMAFYSVAAKYFLQCNSCPPLNICALEQMIGYMQTSNACRLGLQFYGCGDSVFAVALFKLNVLLSTIKSSKNSYKGIAMYHGYQQNNMQLALAPKKLEG